MKTRPSPCGSPSTTGPTVTQRMPASEYGNQARATQRGGAFMPFRLVRDAPAWQVRRAWDSPGMGIFDDLEAEQDRLEEILGGLDGAPWAAPSAAPGWSVAHVVLRTYAA